MANNLNEFVRVSDPNILIYIIKFLCDEDLKALALVSTLIHKKIEPLKERIPRLPNRAPVLDPLNTSIWQTFDFKFPETIQDTALSADGKRLCIVTYRRAVLMSQEGKTAYFYELKNGKFQLLSSHKVNGGWGEGKAQFLKQSPVVLLIFNHSDRPNMCITFNYETQNIVSIEPYQEAASFAFSPRFNEQPDIKNILEANITTLSHVRACSENSCYYAFATTPTHEHSIIIICRLINDEIQFVSQHRFTEIPEKLGITNDGGLLCVKSANGNNHVLNLTQPYPRFAATKSRRGIGAMDDRGYFPKFSANRKVAACYSHHLDSAQVYVCHLRNDGLSQEVRNAVTDYCRFSIETMTMEERLAVNAFQILMHHRLFYDHRIDEPYYIARLHQELSTRYEVPLSRLLSLSTLLRIACVRYFQSHPNADLAIHPGCLGFKLIAERCGAEPFTGVIPENTHSEDVGSLNPADGFDDEYDDFKSAIKRYSARLPNTEKKEWLNEFLENEYLLQTKPRSRLTLPITLSHHQSNSHSFVANLGMHRNSRSKSLLPKGFLKLIEEHPHLRNFYTLEVFIKAVMKFAYAKKDFHFLSRLKEVWSRIEDAVSANPAIWQNMPTLTSFRFFVKPSLIEVLNDTPYRKKLETIFKVTTPIEPPNLTKAC